MAGTHPEVCVSRNEGIRDDGRPPAARVFVGRSGAGCVTTV
jgi:hypothetical protein